MEAAGSRSWITKTYPVLEESASQAGFREPRSRSVILLGSCGQPGGTGCFPPGDLR